MSSCNGDSNGSSGGTTALAVALPLTNSSADGWELITTLEPMIAQNLTMILLTHTGERVMEPTFGVGLESYLFRRFDAGVYAEIEFKIREQVAQYLSAVTIDNIIFDDSEQDSNKLYIAIEYSIPSINLRDILELAI